METRRALRAIILLSFFLLALGFAAFGQDLPLSRVETFDDNEDRWQVGSNEQRKLEIAGGAYRLSDTKTGIIVSHEFPIRRDRDYLLEASISAEGSNKGHYAGLVWDYKDKDNYYQFVFSQGGSYAIAKVEQGKMTTLVPWTSHSAILGKGYANLVGVRRKGSNLRFYFNGNEVNYIAHSTFSGSYVGFISVGPQAIAVDSLSLREERQPSGEKVAKPAGLAPVVERRLDRLGEMWLVSIGKLMGSFREASEKNGPGYPLSHLSRESLDILSTNLRFDLLEDFAIEAELGWLSGDASHEYGLVLDESDGSYIWFGLTASGSYSISRHLGGRKTALVPPVRSDIVERYQSPNRLSVMRLGDRLVFTLNGYKVYEMPYSGWSSTSLGFGASGVLKFKPSFLGVYAQPASERPVYGSCVSGWGVKRFTDGSIHVGFWDRSLPNGPGLRYAKDGKASEGIWKDGTRVSAPTPEAPLFYPVSLASGGLGLVDAAGSPKGFGLEKLLSFGMPVEAPIPIAKDGKLGFVGEGGAPVFSDAWNLASPFYHGYAFVRSPGGAVGVVDRSGRISVPLGAYDIDMNAGFSCGVFVIKSGGSEPVYGLASVDGRLLREPDLEEIGFFSEGYALAKAKNGLYGFIDLTGTWRIAPEYDEAGIFSEGLAYAFTDGYIPMETYIDPTGMPRTMIVTARALTWPYAVAEGLILCSEGDGKIAYYDRSMKPVIGPAEWKDARPFSERRATVRDASGWKYIDKAGAVIAGPFERCQDFSQGYAAVLSQGFWGYIDASGAWALKPQYADATAFQETGLAQVKLASGERTWIRKDGTPIWLPSSGASLQPPPGPAAAAATAPVAPPKPALPPQAASRQKTWKDDFLGNAALWPLGETETASIKLADGRLRVAGKTDAGAQALVPIDFNRGADFTLTAVLRHDSGPADDTIGFIWEADNAGRSLVFALSTDGMYAVLDILPEDTNILAPWTAHKAIKKGSADNKLEIRRRGAKLEFRINGTMVTSLPFVTIGGGNIGFICFYPNALSVDELSLGT